MSGPQNFFDQFDDPAAEALHTKPVRDAARADAAEQRANAAATRAASAEARAQAEYEAKNTLRPPPGDNSLTGEDYLKTLPPALARQVRMVSEGRMALPTGAALRSPAMQELVAAASQFDPALDAANAATRVATRKDFTSGAAAKNKTSINTAIGHLVSLARAAKALNNSNFKAYNSLSNYMIDEVGDPRVNNFNMKRNAVATELAKVFKGTGGAPALAEIHDWQQTINAAQSPEQLRDAVMSGVELLNSRLDALGAQYQAGMGRSWDPMEMLTPHAKEEYEALTSGAIFSDSKEPGKTAGMLDAPPPGVELSGGGVKGYRFTGEQENALLGDIHGENFDPNAFADHATQFAIDNGAVKPEVADDFRKHMLESVQSFVGKPQAERANAVLDYSGVDKNAAEDAGVLKTLGTAITNVPTSAAGFIQGMAAVPADAIASVVNGNRMGSFKTMTDLASELAGKVVGQQDAPTVDAFEKALTERYGSWSGFKGAVAKDPVGIVSDLSMVLSGGGTAANKLGRMAGHSGLETAGAALQAAGRMTDPMSLLQQAPGAARAVVPDGAARLARELPVDALGLPSGVGGDTLREAAGAGFERGSTGAATPRSTAFTQGMRDPGAASTNIVDQAMEAVRNLRTQASDAYTARMSQFGRQPVPLDLDSVRRRMLSIRPRNYDAMLNAPHRPSDHVAWDQMMESVDHYAGQAAQDPTLLEPLQMDAFKQHLYDAGSTIGGAYDRKASRIARTAYNSVRDLLVRHDPIYADTMANYERAAREAQDLERTFSIADTPGRHVNVDTAVRKLQSIMRNNVSTNYGRRAAQGERLDELSGNGEIMAGLAGQSASALTPRGIQRALSVPETAAAGSAAYAAGSVAPLLTLPLLSPRLMGEASYGLGRAAGTVARGARAAIDSDPGRWLRQKTVEYTPQLNALGNVGDKAKETEAERLRRTYGVDIPEYVLNGQ